MMRKGPLDRYPPEWVLREAASRRLSGALEFQTDRPVTVYVDAGAVYAGHGGTVGEAPSDDPPASEDDARTRLEGVLVDLLDQQEGWYFHHPLDHHTGRGPWSWDTSELLLAARRLLRVAHAASRPPEPSPAEPATARTATAGTATAERTTPERTTPERTAPGPVAPGPAPAPAPRPEPRSEPAAARTVAPPAFAAPSGPLFWPTAADDASSVRTVIGLAATRPARPVELGADAWGVVAALCEPAEVAAVRDRLGWSVERLDAAIAVLDAAGVLEAGPAAPADPGAELWATPGAHEGVPDPAGASHEPDRRARRRRSARREG